MKTQRVETARKPSSGRRLSAPTPRNNRAAISNDPLREFNLTTPLGRRARDLFKIAAGEIGGRLSMRQQTAIMNWVRLQLAFETGNVLLAPELRHAWKQVQAARRGPAAKATKPNGGGGRSIEECLDRRKPVETKRAEPEKVEPAKLAPARKTLPLN